MFIAQGLSAFFGHLPEGVTVSFITEIAVLPHRHDQAVPFKLGDMASCADEAGVLGRSPALKGEIIYCGELEVVEGLQKFAFGVRMSRYIIYFITCNLVLFVESKRTMIAHYNKAVLIGINCILVMRNLYWLEYRRAVAYLIVYQKQETCQWSDEIGRS